MSPCRPVDRRTLQRVAQTHGTDWPRPHEHAVRSGSDAAQSPSRGFRPSASVERNDRDPAIAAAVRRAQGGDGDAIRFLYLRYKDNVYGYVLSIVRQEHEAEDVTQQVFLKLMSAIHKYEPRRVPFTAWIIRVARNVALDHQRQRRPVPRAEVFDDAHPADEAAYEKRWGIEHALEALPEDQRGVIVLRHLVGLTPGEIAERLGKTEASVHGLHHRARQALQRKLEDVECVPAAKVA